MAAELRILALGLFNNGDRRAAEKVLALSNDPDIPPRISEAKNTEGIRSHQKQLTIENLYPQYVGYEWRALPEDTLATAQSILDMKKLPYTTNPTALYINCPEQEKLEFTLLFSQASERIKMKEGYEPAPDGKSPCKLSIYDRLNIPGSPISFLGVSFDPHNGVVESHYIDTAMMLLEEANTILATMQKEQILIPQEN